MVSLLKLAEITEQGVAFQSPHDGSKMLLTPEKSVEIQNAIGNQTVFLQHALIFIDGFVVSIYFFDGDQISFLFIIFTNM